MHDVNTMNKFGTGSRRMFVPCEEVNDVKFIFWAFDYVFPESVKRIQKTVYSFAHEVADL